MDKRETPVSRLAAIWVADIAGFSGLSAKDQGAALHQLESFHELVRRAVAAGGGRVVNLVGDGALAEFPSAAASLQAAVEVRDTFADDTENLLRIGIHIGEVVEGADGGLHGDGVKVATRLQEEAAPGEILVSDDIRRQARRNDALNLASLGIRKLRGLDEPVAVFAVHRRGDGDQSATLGWRLSALIRSRRTRVMASVTGVYFATLWTAVEITAFIEARFQLTPNLTDVVIASLLLMLPSVLLVTYYHSGPTRESIPLPEKVGVPANLIVASIVVVLVFGAQDIGAVMQTVAVVDENGATVERQVPRSQYRKRIAIFPFVMRGTGTADWLGEGVAYGVAAKLSQDIFFDIQTPPHFRARLARTPFPDGVGVPAALQREIAEERHLSHYLSGTVEATADGVMTVTLALHDTTRGRPIAEHRLTGPDLFALVDQLSDLVKNDLGIPEWHLETVTDLPVAEMMTDSVEAYAAYIRGATAIAVRDDYDTGRREIQQAVDLDPTFAMAYMALFNVHLFSNEAESAAQASTNLMRYLYRLPERMQLIARHNHAYIQQDTARAFAIIDMGAELYPDDLEIQLIAVQLDAVRNNLERALQRYRHIMELAPDRHQDLHVMAAISEQLGRVDEARTFRETYVARFPEEADGYLQLGDFFGRYGNHRQAQEAYERAALLDGENPEVLRRLALAMWNQLHFDDAMRMLDTALEASRSAQQRTQVLSQRSGFYQARGMMQSAVGDMEAAMSESSSFLPPVIVLIQRMQQMRLHVLAGDAAVAEQTIEAIAAQLQPPWDRLAAIGRLNFAVAVEDADRISAAAAVVQELSESVGFEFLRGMAVYGMGRAAELRGDCVTALPLYEEERQLNPQDSSIGHQIARCQLAMGNLHAAVGELERTLTIDPTSAPTHVTMARVQRARGDEGAARRHLEAALQIWELADSGYRPAAEARAELAQLIVSSQQ